MKKKGSIVFVLAIVLNFAGSAHGSTVLDSLRESQRLVHHLYQEDLQTATAAGFGAIPLLLLSPCIIAIPLAVEVIETADAYTDAWNLCLVAEESINEAEHFLSEIEKMYHKLFERGQLQSQTGSEDLKIFHKASHKVSRTLAEISGNATNSVRDLVVLIHEENRNGMDNLIEKNPLTRTESYIISPPYLSLIKSHLITKLK